MQIAVLLKATLLIAALGTSPSLFAFQSQARGPKTDSLPDAPSSSLRIGTNDDDRSSPPTRTPGTSLIPSEEPSAWNSYMHDLVGPGSFIGPLFASAFDQTHGLKVAYPSNDVPGAGKHPAHGTVPEWDQGVNGYAKRYASRYGQSLIGTTVRYGLGAALNQDVSYHRCSCTDVFPRSIHAMSSSLIAYRADGKPVFSLPAVVAPFAAAEVAVYGWYPTRFNTSDALRTSVGGYISLPMRNLFIEFARR